MNPRYFVVATFINGIVVGTFAWGQLADWDYSRYGPTSGPIFRPSYLSNEPASAPADEAGGKSNSDLAKETQNPVANLISVPFQNNFNFGIGPKHATQWVMNIQPVIPVSLNEDWNLITRTILPVIYQDSPADGVSSAFGIGDLNPTLFLSPIGSKKFIWGAGVTMTVPIGTAPQLTSGKWSAGPAFVALTMQGPWVIGALVNNQWSFAGWGHNNVNALLLQPFVNYNLPDGWYLSSAPILTANWETSGGNAWTVPVGGGFGKIVKIGKLPVNFGLQIYDNVVRPKGGPDWQLRFQIQFLFPK
jgi:hypothetical protein